MSISPVRKKLVECHLGVAHDKNIQLQHSDAPGANAISPPHREPPRYQRGAAPSFR
jgi:hypothetical protein